MCYSRDFVKDEEEHQTHQYEEQDHDIDVDERVGPLRSLVDGKHIEHRKDDCGYHSHPNENLAAPRVRLVVAYVFGLSLLFLIIQSRKGQTRGIVSDAPRIGATAFENAFQLGQNGILLAD